MPRIDPQQLLTCLNVLLSPDGGILSMNEVARLANLMTKFSKKLVSKCIYILILKNTIPDLLFAFMGVGGWDLIQIWLQDGIQNKNWALVTELLELLLLTPVDVDRLKSNNLPKIVKGLTKREDLKGIQLLSTQLVQQWLKIVKEVTKKEGVKSEYDDNENADPRLSEQTINAANDSTVNAVDIATDNATLVDSDANTYTADNGYRLVVRDGKQILCKLVDDDAAVDNVNNKHTNDIEQYKKSSSSSKHKSSSKSSSRDKDRSSSSKSRDRDRSSSSSSNSKSKSSNSSSNRDKDRRNSSSHNSSSSSKHRSSSSSNSNSKSPSSKDIDKDSRDSKEKQADKDKDTLAKIQPPSLSKVGRIPKKSDSLKREDSKPTPKPSFSVEIRKNSEEKPKTVKVFNSKLRSTGLLDEAKPPPPRNATKKPATASPQALKRSSTSSPPTEDANTSGNTVLLTTPPPEKKARLSDPESTKPERPGSIKLIPPKPKPAFLQESDIFMDALAASATKSPKKRKRKLSVSKEPPTSPPATTKPTITSPTSLKNITPANFYQDTLQSESIDADAKDESCADLDEEINKQSPEEPSSDEAVAPAPATTKTDINGLKGVLSYSKKKGPKKTIRWKPESDLVEIQYFELDETERVNVTKTFMDMARMEMSGEREALLKSRKLINEDIMDAQTAWRTLHEIDLTIALVVPGFKSIEKDIQFAREKNVLQAIYFSKLLVPDSGAEPDPETHLMSDPVSMPLEDGDHADDALPVHSWPEPKGSPPHPITHPPLNMFNSNPGLMPPNFSPGGGPVLHPGMVPPFGPDNFMPGPPPGMGGVEWANDPLMMGQNGMFNNGPPPNFIPNKAMMPPPQFPNGPMNGPGPGFPPPPGPPSGFPGGPGPGPGPPGRGGRGGHFNNMMRGGRGGSGWVRMSGNNNGGGNNNNNPQQWNRLNGPPIGAPGGAKRGRFCNNVKNHGFCRNRDTCPFIHPN